MKFKKIVGLTESDSKFGSSASGNSQMSAIDDTSYWGEPLALFDGGYRFTKQYLYITLMVDLENDYNGLTGIDYIDFTLSGTGARNLIWRGKAFNSDVFGSRSRRLIIADDDILIRIRINTEDIYNIGSITGLECKLYYGLITDNNSLYGTWNIKQGEADTLVARGIKWSSSGGSFTLHQDTIQYRDQNTDNVIYDTNKHSFCPNSKYNGAFYLRSIDTNGAYNEKFFLDYSGTGDYNGAIRLYSKISPFFSGSSGRIPSHMKFTGKDKSNNHIERIYIYSNSTDNSSGKTNQGNTYLSFSKIDWLKDFSKIEQLYCCFGGDTTNYILVNNNLNFYNTEYYDYSLKFNLDDNKGNYFMGMNFKEKTINGEPKETEVVELEGRLKGSIALENFFPYEIKNIRIIHKDSNSKVNIGFKIQDSKIQINEVKPYDCWISKEQLDWKEQELIPGDYKIECQMRNKLNIISNPEIYKNFEVQNLYITHDKGVHEYAAFEGPQLSIRYGDNYDHTVPGNIICKNEYLYFSNKPFKVFSLIDGSSLNINDYIVYILYKNVEIQVSSFPSGFQYSTLLEKISSPQDATTEFNFRLIFKNGGTSFEDTIHTQNFNYILGRNKEPVLEFYKVDEKTIRYYLSDNGVDRRPSEGISANQFIEKRKSNEYFNLSRQVRLDNTIPEILRITLYELDSTGETIDQLPLKIGISNDNLNILLELLKEGKMNSLSFENLKVFLSEQDQGKLDNFMDKSRLGIELRLNYVYATGVEQTLFEISISDITFLQTFQPLALRKKGVIINPKEKEELVNTNGRSNSFVINVKDLKLDNGKLGEHNGLRIVFETEEKENGSSISLPVFEIFLDENREICFSNGTTKFKPFSQKSFDYTAESET